MKKKEQVLLLYKTGTLVPIYLPHPLINLILSDYVLL